MGLRGFKERVQGLGVLVLGSRALGVWCQGLRGVIVEGFACCLGPSGACGMSWLDVRLPAGRRYAHRMVLRSWPPTYTQTPQNPKPTSPACPSPPPPSLTPHPSPQDVVEVMAPTYTMGLHDVDTSTKWTTSDVMCYFVSSVYWERGREGERGEKERTRTSGASSLLLRRWRWAG